MTFNNNEVILNDTRDASITGVKAERGKESEKSVIGWHKPKVRIDDGRRQLVFAPLAWLKMRFLLHAGDTEVGEFGIAAKDDLLYIEELAVPTQRTTEVSVEFDDAAVADHVDGCFDRDIVPSCCGRIWIHTHPGASATPSMTDERTFARAFGGCDWAVMAIVARGGASYARLRFAAGPGGSVVLPVVVDWQRLPQDLLDKEGLLDEIVSGWMDEYGTVVHPAAPLAFEMPSAIDVPTEMAAAMNPWHDHGPSEYLDEADRFDELVYQQQLMEHGLWDAADYFDAQEVMS